MNLDQLREKHLNMKPYAFNAITDEYFFTTKEIAEVEKFGQWFQAIWSDKIPLTTTKLKTFYAAKSCNCKDRSRLEELWFKYKKYEIPF